MRKKIGIKAIILVFAGLMMGSVWVSIGAASRGSELLELEGKIQEVSAENRRMKMEMVNETSLLSIAEKAEELGMKSPEKIFYLNSEAGRSSLAEAR